MSEAGKMTGGAAVGSAGLFSQVFHVLSPAWSAALGAVAGMLAHLFRAEGKTNQ